MPHRDRYTSAEILGAERRHLFSRSWLAAASAEDVPHPGDYLTLEIVAEPLVIVRGHDGAVRAFRNVCRHRGLLLLEGAGHVRV